MNKLASSALLTVTLAAALSALLPATAAAQTSQPAPSQTATSQTAQADQITVYGQPIVYSGARISTWAVLKAGRVSRVGVTVPFSVVAGAGQEAGQAGAAMPGMTMNPGAAPAMTPPMYAADFPEAVREQTYFDHFQFDWMEAGHGPGPRYMTPHFDFHFYGVPQASVLAVDCKNPRQAPPADLPGGWTPAAPPQLPDPTLACIPGMGYHSLPATEFGPQGPLSGPFSTVMVAGFYDGRFTFVEPMLTRAALMRRESFTLPVPQPRNLGRATLYPAQFDAVFDRASDSYSFVFSDFRTVR